MIYDEEKQQIISEAGIREYLEYSQCFSIR